jgi:hypothetical protein
MDSRKVAAQLADVDPFRELDEQTRLGVAERATRRVVERGQVIYGRPPIPARRTP